ncbi:MAG: hypothetical protein AAGF44_12950 [Pseudomonadota bacterium]
MTEITSQAIALDIVRLLHILVMAVAIGTVAFTDYSMLRRVYEPIRPGWARFLGRIHVFLMVTFGITWATGLILIGAKTGFDPSKFSPVLCAKLAVVSVLLGTAIGIRRIVVPAIMDGVGGTLIDLPWPIKKTIGMFAGLSLAGWTSALIIGGSEVLKAASFETILAVVASIYALAIALVLYLFWYTHRCYGDPLARLQRSPAY